MIVHTGEKPFACTKCDYSGNLKSNLLIHFRRRHGDNWEEMANLIRFNKTASTNIKSADIHVKTSTAQDGNDRESEWSNKKDIPGKSGGIYPCHMCSQKFKDLALLKQHFETHKGNMLFPCPMCDQKFANFAAVSEHFSASHSRKPESEDVKPVVNCPKGKEHIKSPKTSLNAPSQKRHSVNYEGEQNKRPKSEIIPPGESPNHLREAKKNIKCPQISCGKKFQSINDLKQHKLLEHNKPHKCHKCGKGFKNKKVWKSHSERCEVSATDLSQSDGSKFWIIL